MNCPLVRINFAALCAFNSDTSLVDDDDVQEDPDLDLSYRRPSSDLSKWRNRPNIGSIHEVDVEVDPEGSSLTTSSSHPIDGEDYMHVRVDSPPALDVALRNIKDERRYRMLLQHEFHPSRTFLLIQLRGLQANHRSRYSNAAIVVTIDRRNWFRWVPAQAGREVCNAFQRV